MPDIYSNADASTQLDIKSNSLNKKRTRLTQSGTLTEGEHWFKQDNDIFWTQAGLDVLSEGQALVLSEGQTLSSPSDSVISPSHLPSPDQVAKDNAPAIVARYLSAVDREMENEVTRLLSEGSLKKHLSSRWGIAS